MRPTLLYLLAALAVVTIWAGMLLLDATGV